MVSVVASRYAKALVDVVTGRGSSVDPAAALAQLRTVEQLIEASPELRNVLLSPAVAPSRKREVIARILSLASDGALASDAALSKPVRNFIYVVIDHRRVADFGSIVTAFEMLLDQHLGFVRADVETARPLVAAQQAALEAEISRVAGKKAKLKYSIEPGLIAGAVARIGSTVYDGSVRGQLDRLRLKLARG
jgi:F-type H+-transporting ATPase subunit delta